MKIEKTAIISMSLVAIFIVAIISGCGSGSGNSSSEGTGAFSMSIDWPDGGNSSEKLIPAGSQTISCSITGDFIADPITTSISYSETVLTVSNIPAGRNVALIKALNASSNLMAQRKVSFIINANQTTTSESVPLGIAVTGTASLPVFEPTSINAPYGTQVYIQNWQQAAYTCRVRTNNSNIDQNLPSAYTGPGSIAVFPEIAAVINGYCPVSLVGFSSTAATALSRTDNYQFSTKWSITGQGWHITIDPGNNLYATSVNDENVYKFDQNGNLLTSWPTQSGAVCGIAYSSAGYLYLTGNTKTYIKKFSLTGEDLGTINSDLSGPIGTATDASGNLYVAEGLNLKIRIFNPSGTELTQWSTGTLSKPHGIAVDSSGNIYAACHSNHMIKKFNSAGTLLKTFGGPGTTEGLFNYPTSVAVDNFGYVYAGDRNNAGTWGTNSRIQKFDSNGGFVKVIADYGTGDGQIQASEGLVLDPAGNIYATDRGNSRIQKFIAVP